jgi:hypothetical protein
MSNVYAELSEVIYAEAYEFLQDHYPKIAKLVERGVRENVSPEDLRRHWLKEAGDHSTALARRIENAAKYLVVEQRG